MLDELLKKLGALPPEEVLKIEQDAIDFTSGRYFIPNPGPQEAALESEADELFYGGAAGAGKTAMLVGLAIDHHERSIIIRREYPQIKGIVDETARMLGTREGYNGQDRVWKLPRGNVLEFGSVPHEDD